MQAIMLIDAATRHAGARRRKRFKFRGVHPMFHDHDLRLAGQATRPGGRAMTLGTAAPGGYLGMTAEAGWD
jgi:3-methylfumaryl-CoA hydratase